MGRNLNLRILRELFVDAYLAIASWNSKSWHLLVHMVSRTDSVGAPTRDPRWTGPEA